MLRVEPEADGAVVALTLDRPHAKNAIDHATLDALTAALETIATDRKVRAVILTGAGGVFASGGDLRELHGRTSEAEAAAFADAGEAICRQIEALDVPVLAKLSGAAIGAGAELALACDFRIADTSAMLSFKQVRMGVTTAWGTVPRLVSVVGHARAARLLYTACEIGSAEAHGLGLVDALVVPDALAKAAMACALEIVAGSPRAIADIKALLRRTRAPSSALARAERTAFIETWTGPDHTEAMTAYFARRPPVWRDR